MRAGGFFYIHKHFRQILVQINKPQQSATFRMVDVLIYLSTSSAGGNTLTRSEKNNTYSYMYKGAKGVKVDVDK